MLKSYKYRLLPTEQQAEHLDGSMRAGRLIYNLALETKIRAWESANIRLSAFDLMRQLTELLDNEGKWLRVYYKESLESQITRVEKSYKSFFDGNGYPKFKNKVGRQSTEYRRGVRVKNNQAKIPKLGWVYFVEHRPLSNGEIRTCTVSKDLTGKYFISILVKDNLLFEGKQTICPETAIGIDLGLKSFATLSDGLVIDNPKYFGNELKRLRIEQRKLSRRFKPGQKEQSKSWEKQKLVVALLHEKIANKRKDFLHKLSHHLISDFDTICIEDLNIKGMIKNGNLSKAISDVSWSEFIRLLTYKSDWYGKNLIKIGRFDPSSKMCSECGTINKELELKHREWICPNCGSFHDRDINAAINIKNFGLKAQASTANVA